MGKRIFEIFLHFCGEKTRETESSIQTPNISSSTTPTERAIMKVKRDQALCALKREKGGKKEPVKKKCKQPIRLRTHFYSSFFILTWDLTSIYLVKPTRGDNPLESNGDWRTIVPNHSHWWLDCTAVRTRVSKGAQYLASSWMCLSRRGAHGRNRWQDMCPHSGILRDGLVRKREKLGKSPVRQRGGDTEWGRDRGREGVGTDCRTNPHSSRLL